MKRYGYLDIETTGLSRRCCDLTVVGIAVVGGEEIRVEQLVDSAISVDRLVTMLASVDELYTYNGSRFDLPFIRRHMGIDLRRHVKHTDLMYTCWKHNLKGGLKAVERRLGIRRQLADVDGYVAVQLWWRYVNDHDQDALETLLQYNREDVVNLHTLRCRLGVL